MGFGYTLKDGDWKRLRQIIQKLSSLNLGPDATPTFKSITLASATISSLSVASATISTIQGGNLIYDSATVSSLVATTAVISTLTVGTANVADIDIANPSAVYNLEHDNFAGGHQAVATTAAPTFVGLTIEGSATVSALTAVTANVADIAIANPSAVYNLEHDGFSNGHQDVRITASPSFYGLSILWRPEPFLYFLVEFL